VEVQDKSVEANINKDNDQTVHNLKEVKKKECRVTELEEDVCSLKDTLINQHKVEEVKELHEELAKKDAKIMDMEQEIYALEAALRDHGHMAELEELVVVVRQKDERIEELEEALRESVRITAEREMVLQEEESCRKQIMEKVSECKRKENLKKKNLMITCHAHQCFQ
jgi:ELKS/RAB6-interacting/CAST family protein 1